jgi:hypothetical protein
MRSISGGPDASLVDPAGARFALLHALRRHFELVESLS